MKNMFIESLFSRITFWLFSTTIEFASVDGPQRLLCLKNSSNSSGQNVVSQAVAQYSSVQPASTKRVQSHRSSPIKAEVKLWIIIRRDVSFPYFIAVK